jgi:O-acetyl-ADP-ribose deacetylase (regulator of RNase III)
MDTVLADRLQVIQGDITALDVDIIVNAANTKLFRWRRG